MTKMCPEEFKQEVLAEVRSMLAHQFPDNNAYNRDPNEHYRFVKQHLDHCHSIAAIVKKMYLIGKLMPTVFRQTAVKAAFMARIKKDIFHG